MDLQDGYIDPCPGNTQGASGYLFLTLINSLLGSKCKLGSRDPYNEDYSSKLQDGDEFDFIVVGSGSAGSVVANKLSENPYWKVLVLEAGGYPSATSDIPAMIFSLQGTEEDWQYKTEPSETSCLGFKDKQCKWPRGKALGGSSTLNAMLYLKGFKRDYDHWAELGNVGWDWESVKEEYEALADIHEWRNKYNIGDPIKEALDESYKLKNYRNLDEENPEDPIGTLVATSTVENGIRYNAAKAFLGKFKNRPNLFVSTNSLVKKVIIDARSKTATGVQVKISEKILTLKASKEVILSEGTINSAQTLMLSGVGPKEHLKEVGIDLIEDLPVGKNLQDHLMHFGFDISLTTDSMAPENRPENILNELFQYFMYQTGSLSSIGMTNYWGFINTKNDSVYPNIQYLHIFNGQHDNYLEPEIGRGTGMIDEVFQSKMNVLETSNLLTLASILLNPKSNGRVVLKSKNPDDSPLIFPGYLTDKLDEDINVMLEAVRFLESLIEEAPLQKFHPQIVKLNLPGCDEYEFRSDEYWRCSLRHLATTIYHPTSTCTMGPSDDGNSVVDPRLRVHGIKKLRVIDASIMPKIVSANPQATVMMIGHKGGVMITEDWLEKHEEL